MIKRGFWGEGEGSEDSGTRCRTYATMIADKSNSIQFDLKKKGKESLLALNELNWTVRPTKKPRPLFVRTRAENHNLKLCEEKIKKYQKIVGVKKKKKVLQWGSREEIIMEENDYDSYTTH